MRRNHEILQKDEFKGREFKLIGSHPKSDVRTISGGIYVFVHTVCLIVKMKMSKFSIFRFVVRVTPIERPREDKKIETWPNPERCICKEKLESKCDFIASAQAQCTVFRGGSYLQYPLTLQP